MKRKRGQKEGKKGPSRAAKRKVISTVASLNNTGNNSNNFEEHGNDEYDSTMEVNTPSSTGTSHPLNVARIKLNGSTDKAMRKPVGYMKVRPKTPEMLESLHSDTDTDKSSSQMGFKGQGGNGEKLEDIAISLSEMKMGISGNALKKSGSIRSKPSVTFRSSNASKTGDGMAAHGETSHQKGPKTPNVDHQYNKEELDAALMVIQKVMEMDASEPFNAPVNPKALGIPDYFDAIDTPMDFGTICSNLENGVKYMNSEDVFSDVQYIWENCNKYNNKGDCILDLMRQVKKFFMKYWTAAGLYDEQARENNGGPEVIQVEDVSPPSQGKVQATGGRSKSGKRHGNISSMPQTGDSSFPSTSRSTPASTEVDSSLQNTVHFNKYGLAIDDEGKTSTKLSKLTKSLVPISYKKWKDVPETFKKEVWKQFREAFPEYKDSQYVVHMKRANHYWRQYKHTLRGHLKGDNVEQWKCNLPQGVNAKDWEPFCDHEAAQDQKEMRLRNKAIKVNSTTKTTHNTGRAGYARREAKLARELGREPSRPEVWLNSHMRKSDGTYAAHDQKWADEMMINMDTNPNVPLDKDAVSKTFGKDKKGSSRGIGPISSRGVIASQYARELLTEAQGHNDEIINELKIIKDDLKNELRGAMETFKDDLRNELKSGQFTTPSSSAVPYANGTPTSASHKHTYSGELVPCQILGFTREVIGSGRKTNPGIDVIVHGHRLTAQEAKVIVDEVKQPGALLWDGTQGCATTLGEIYVGGFIYWLDCLLPPLA